MPDTVQGRRRVVVTGWGAVTPLALTVDETWQAMLAGRSGIGPITCIDASDLPTSIAGEVTGFDPKAYLDHRRVRRMDPYSQYAYAAAVQAAQMAKLDTDGDLGPRAGVLIGSGYGPMTSLAEHVVAMGERGPRAVSPFAPVTGAIDSAAGEISLAFGAQGPSRAMSSACASGTDAIGEAARWIRHGVADVVVAGGAENILTRVDMAGSGNAKALSTRVDTPSEASRPFDADRDGFVMSAGAGVLIMESEEHALARGAPILTEVAGHASTSDAYHWTAPHPEGRGVRAAMSGALADAGLTPNQVDYINAHGTSTLLNDVAELASIRAVFGDRAEQIPISSTKSMTGHMIGAAGAFEAIVSALAINTGVVPPTINCHRPIDSRINFVAHTAQEHVVDVAMSNSFGFGGHNAVVVLRRWQP
ncbi:MULTISPECIES: beta-ketoacyl-ACP synthase II [unclassified Micromonospora]|uniref:beta-ketoacyl-ACP synthase II n=1 Tax=unclassified Micromonospora TaxID=2617518 RepID=UPI0022B605B6|nr:MULTISPECIES: beta-ketoacyl-ACP synthase II [unclassified Micromonospora]MCZ7421943.1 beta-ketoacyl-ACP synthase II [Verrucosispora sp. WMMA2121]WBB93322.1 beta-ketoacyl-ACP synthase II [Verrucosispora sp. WMMC514]